MAHSDLLFSLHKYYFNMNIKERRYIAIALKQLNNVQTIK